MGAQGSSGRKKRKPGDWVAVAKGRANSAHSRETVSRRNRDIPGMQEMGSAAYRRAAVKKARRGQP